MEGGSGSPGGGGAPGGRVFEARERRFGGCFEDYEVGDEYRHWPGKTITEAESHLFCMLTLAVHPLHVDSAFFDGTQGPFERPVVAGPHVYSLLLGMSVPDISGRALANLGTTDLRHTAPVYPGDTLYGASTVIATRPSRSRPDAGIVTVETVGRNQDGAVVTTYRRSVLLPRRSTDDD